MNRVLRIPFPFLLVFSMVLGLGQSSTATTVRLLTLEQIVNAADRIFVGRCVAVETRRDEHGLPATYATFEVTEGIKGQLGATVTIKQIGDQKGVLRIPDLPTYTVGEEVMLFLHPTSRYGFTSPVGLHQGKWTVATTSSGKKLFRRSVSGSLLVKGAAGALYGARIAKKGPVQYNYSIFLSHVKKLAARPTGPRQ